MTRFRIWATLVLVLAILGGGSWAFWNYEMRWWPKTITRHQAEITRILESSGWAAPGLPGKRLYMVSFRTCPDCLRFKAEEFPALHANNVDTRVIEVARADKNGIAKSTAVERATVAQIWLTHDWKLMQAWESVPVEAWKAPGIAPADGDMARTAVIEAGRTMVEDLRPLLKANGVNFAYPCWSGGTTRAGCAAVPARSARLTASSARSWGCDASGQELVGHPGQHLCAALQRTLHLRPGAGES